ncbi:MAG: YfhO family protein [Muribaculaceae bacterium]|nr:YfhO family protein [Muribaculaceae bacterium]
MKKDAPAERVDGAAKGGKCFNGHDIINRLKETVKSPRFLGAVAAILFIAALSWCYFYPDAAQGNILQQPDTQQGIANGHEIQTYAEATGEKPLWTNSLFSGMPTFQISPSYASNRLFNWINSLAGLGLPSPANLLAMMMLGFFIMMLAMRAGVGVSLLGAVAYGFSSYFLIIIGAGHIWKFITLAYIPPTIGGIALAYRGRYLAGGALAAVSAMMQIAANHVQMTYYFLLVIVGLVIAYLVMAVREKKLAQWGKATGALVVAAVLAVGANLPSLYYTAEYSKETMRGNHSELTAATEADAAESSTGGLDRDYITQYSYQPSETFTFLIPNLKGGATTKPEGGSFVLMSLADTPEAAKLKASGSADEMTMQYLGWTSQYFGDPEGTNGPVYIGAIIVALFLLGCVIVKGPVKWALLVLTVLSVLLSWGRHFMGLTDFMIDYFPMYNKFRTVESILVIAEFTMPLLACLALKKLLEAPRGEMFARYGTAMIATFGVAAFFCLIAIVWPTAFGELISEGDVAMDQRITEAYVAGGYSAEQVRQVFSLDTPAISTAIEKVRAGMVESDAIRSLLLIVASLGFIWVASRFKFKPIYTTLGLTALVLIDLYPVDKRYLDHASFIPRFMVPTNQPIAKTPADEKILQDTTMNFRVLDMGRFNSPDPSYFHKAIGGYHAAKLTRYQDLIDRHLINFPTRKMTQADFRILNMLNGRYLITQDGKVLDNPRAQGNAWFVDTLVVVKGADAEMDALGEINPVTTAVVDEKFASILGDVKPHAAGDTIFETTYAPNRLTYHAKTAAGATAVFSEVFFPWGWKATIDGEPVDIARVNYILRAFPIPAGSHTIVMEFDPPSIHATVGVARVSVIMIYIAVAAAICVWLTGCRCCRRKETDDETTVIKETDQATEQND